jgi:DNA-directed RNA polymerase subunit beta
MGSNMQRQAVPLLTTEAPIIGTGMETRVGMDSLSRSMARHDWCPSSVDASRIILKYEEKK